MTLSGTENDSITPILMKIYPGVSYFILPVPPFQAFVKWFAKMEPLPSIGMSVPESIRLPDLEPTTLGCQSALSV